MIPSQQEKHGAYTANQRTNEDGRETDKRALLACASRLQKAIDDKGADMKEYRDAIKHNQHLWTIFQVAVSDPANPLPTPIKITLLNLSRNVDRLSFRAVTEFSPQLLTQLIDINRQIATGLARRPGESGAPQQSGMPVAAPPIVGGSVITSA